jgi:hypothetical protein
MIIRNDITADTYNPLPFSNADFRRLQEAVRVHAPDVVLDLCNTDDGVDAHDVPYVSVTVPGAGLDDAPPCITRNERGWQMVRGEGWPLYEFATEREIAEFLGSGMIRPRR